MLAAAVLAAGAAATAPATPAQLALMPLPKSALPAAAGGRYRSTAARESCRTPTPPTTPRAWSPPAVSRGSGGLTGYSLDYADSGLSALVRGRGLLGIETSVDLYRDVEAARAGMAFWRADETRVLRS